jgi:hypothetical protein
MKQIKNYFLFSILELTAFAGCRKEDNPLLPDLIRVPTPLITKDATTSQVIDAQNPDNFSGKFMVDLFFEDDVQPEKFDIVVIKNGDRANPKLLNTVTTFPTTLTITGTQLKNLFGTPIVLGDRFDIGANIVIGGQTYLAFPTTGVAHASGVAGQPGASTFIRYEAVCEFNPSIYAGDFEVVTDEWGDYNPGDIVQITPIDATSFSFKYPADDAEPIIIKVNPADNSVSVTKQVYGSGYGSSWAFGLISAESVPSIENFVAPCDGVVSVVLKHTVSAGNFGNFKIVLKKA